MSDTLIWLSEVKGKKYVRTDQPTLSKAPHAATVGHRIPIKGDFGSTSGELGIVKVAVTRDTEIAVLYPRRGGVYNPKHIEIKPRPSYHDAQCDPKWWFDPEQKLVYMELCINCGDYQRRTAFTPDKRKRNGLYSVCKTCWKGYMHTRRAA